MIPRLAQIAMLGLFTAGLALQSLHLGHDISFDEVAECECVATDRLESAVFVLPDVLDATRSEIVPATSVAAASGRNPDLFHKARAPPLA